MKDRGVWRAEVCGVTKSWTWLSNWTAITLSLQIILWNACFSHTLPLIFHVISRIWILQLNHRYSYPNGGYRHFKFPKGYDHVFSLLLLAVALVLLSDGLGVVCLWYVSAQFHTLQWSKALSVTQVCMHMIIFSFLFIFSINIIKLFLCTKWKVSAVSKRSCIQWKAWEAGGWWRWQVETCEHWPPSALQPAVWVLTSWNPHHLDGPPEMENRKKDIEGKRILEQVNTVQWAMAICLQF